MQRIKVQNHISENNVNSEAYLLVSVLLNRGGGQWTPYDKLTQTEQNQWDAYESVLCELSEGKIFLVSGFFEKVPSQLSVYAITNDCLGIIGMCEVSNRDELHSLLISNPNEHYGFLILKEQLPHKDIISIAALHNRGSDLVDKDIVTMCNNSAYCLIEENVDRDWFALATQRRYKSEIINTIQNVLKKFSLPLYLCLRQLGNMEGKKKAE